MMRSNKTTIWQKNWYSSKGIGIVPAIILILTTVWFSATKAVSAGQNWRTFEAGSSPTVVSYQGLVSVSDVPFNGTGYFKFAIVDQAGTDSFWSNDGTSTNGAEPVNAVALSVANGLFDVLLGDNSLTHMSQALAASVFEDTDRYLRVWFSSDNADFIQLSPDQLVAAVPYSLQAEEAKNAGESDRLDGREGSAYQQQVTGNCASGSAIQEIATDGTVSCETDDNTAYSGGNQLSLSGSTFSVEESSGSGLDADLLDGLDSYTYQNRVNGACWDTSAVVAINSDGSVICETHSIRPGFSTTAFSDNYGYFSSITIGADGLPIISFIDGSLKVAHCNDIACTSARISTLDNSLGSFSYTSITIGADGLGLISYYRFDYGDLNGDLKVAHCNNTACTSAMISTIDAGADDAGEYSSITIGTDGLGLISYYRFEIYGELRVAHCENTACTSVTITTIHSGVGERVGYSTSIAIGADGFGLISYWDYYDDDLRVVHCENTACTSATTTTIGNSDRSPGTSLVIGTDGLGLISYYDFIFGSQNGDLKVAHCNNTACSSVTTTIIGSNVGFTDTYFASTSITIGADGRGLISYHHWVDGDLKVAHCGNTNCTSASTATIDSVDNVGGFSSITIGADGLGVISYNDRTNKALKVAHLSNVFGIPYFQRR